MRRYKRECLIQMRVLIAVSLLRVLPGQKQARLGCCTQMGWWEDNQHQKIEQMRLQRRQVLEM